MKSTVTRRQTTVDAATVIEPEKSGKDLKLVPHALQSAFLSGNLGEPVTVCTINGITLVGKLRQFDQFTLLLQVPDGLDTLAFKTCHYHDSARQRCPWEAASTATRWRISMRWSTTWSIGLTTKSSGSTRRGRIVLLGGYFPPPS